MNLLIAGGKEDPNIRCLIDSAEIRDITLIPLITQKEVSPAFTWSFDNDDLYIEQWSRKIDAAFVRRNVFHEPGASQHDRSVAWYTSVAGYLLTHPKVKVLNRSCLGKSSNKQQVLHMAKHLGLTIPKTVITNVPKDFRSVSTTSAVAKPVMGGGYCEEIDHLMENTELRSLVTANPAIVQQEIKGDDIRVFRIGELFLGFQIKSDILDYRKAKNNDIRFMPNLPENVISLLKKLMDKLEFDWGAADFKRDRLSGKYYFLEVNSNPMFSVFDTVCGRQISDAILTYLSD